MPNIDMTDKKISDYFDVLQRYECINRVTKAKIRMVRIGFKTDGKYVTRAYVSCLTHNESRHCENKTEALFQARQPWVWCDGCAKIHEATVWQTLLDATKENAPANYW